MALHQTMRLAFAWWNTSLSPTRRPNRAGAEDMKVVVDVVSTLLNVLSVDCLGLGEVCSEDLRRIRDELDASEFSIVDGTERIQRTSFDLGVIFRNSKLREADSVSVTAAYGQHQLKLAQRIDFQVAGVDRPLHVFASHWPSRLWAHEDQPIRDILGVRLGDAICELRSFYPDEPTIVLMGDYNDEPFDPALSGHLLASRDRRLVRKNRGLLYNPFWRFLGEREPHVPGRVSRPHAGTFYHSSGDTTKWRTFDQILFSSACLLGQPWHINEELTCVLEIPPLDTLVQDSGWIFDHFPVTSVLETDFSLSEVTNG